MRRHIDWGDGSLPAWLWKRVQPEPNSGCWLWTSSVSGDGYGIIEPKRWPECHAHRAVLSFVEPLDPGLVVDHMCHTRCCVNPEHLRQITREENSRWRLANKACARGHVYEGHTKTVRSRTGGTWTKRVCMICKKAADAAGHLRRKAAKAAARSL